MTALIFVMLLLHNFYRSSILTVKWQKAKFDRNSKFHLVKYCQISLPQDFVQRIKSFLKLASRGLPDLYLVVLLNL